ncbi:PrgI family protein [Patescibacteria group bacterium]|nr:PrgI family protein [Patescibacteria group bacterium]
MEFTIPQFIEQSPKIVGPLTWRQFLLIGGAGIVIFFLYFTIKHLFLFLVISIFLLGLAVVFAFLKIGGRNIFAVLTNFVVFTISSKLYIWQKKRIPPKIILKKEEVGLKKEEIDKISSLKMSKKSKLSNLSTQIETRTK